MASKTGKRSSSGSEPTSTGTISSWHSFKTFAEPIVIGAFWTFCHFYLILDTSGALNSFLFPVYGSILGSRYHKSLDLAALIISGSTYSIWTGSTQTWSQLLAVFLLVAPNIPLYLSRYSGRLGPSAGPLFTGLITTFPVTLIAAVVANQILAQKLLSSGRVEQRGMISGFTPRLVTAIVSLVAYRTAISEINVLNGTLFARSKHGLYYLLAIPQALYSSSKYLVVVLLPMLYLVLFSVHTPFPHGNNLLNGTLQEYGYSLVARQDSNTGYISVLDNSKDGFRVMRCDHSLLGGEWFPQPGFEDRMREPVYAIFVMLEAVRLVQPDSAVQKERNVQKEALVIGLGIGTTPSALVAHGVRTTVVEIDPVVHEFATRYFRLPSNHTSVIQDATAFVIHYRHDARYDYIIHDVFTGGAEPINLFTVEFLNGLKDMLDEQGVIAINYAGDLQLRSASMVIRTVLSVFPACRLFREDAGPTEDTVTDFTNLVMFCRKAAGSFSFRQPTRADFLGSQARQHHLLPRHEVNPTSFVNQYGKDIVRENNTQELAKAQIESALGHWKVMRSVIPDAVWENW